MGCYLMCSQRAYLGQPQRLGLKQLLLLDKKLRHPQFPNAARGFEGMQTAHQILKERGACGVLIGGLAEAVWNQQRKPEELYQHKDVDVAVLDDHFELGENFEGGIDWWIAQNGKISLESDASRVGGVQKRWYENGNGVLLSFGVKRNTDLNPGLYIPDSDWIVDMRVYEADANVDYSGIEAVFDEDVFEKFRYRIRNRIKTRLPRFVREEFEGYVLSPHYEEDYFKIDSVDLERFDLEIIRAINGLK